MSTWPVNPVDVIISKLRAGKQDMTIIDFGCGDANLARMLDKRFKGPHRVRSFDLHASEDGVVEMADSKSVPVRSKTADAAVFSLSLMGNNWVEFIREAKRVLKTQARLIVAEVLSRFAREKGDGKVESGVNDFIQVLKAEGFDLVKKVRLARHFHNRYAKHTHQDSSNRMFIVMEFVKVAGESGLSSTKKPSKGKASSGNISIVDPSHLLKPCVYKKR